MPRLLLVDDSEPFLEALSRALSRDYEVATAASAGEAREQLAIVPDGMLLDLRLDERSASNEASLQLLREVKSSLPQMPVIMITAHGDVESAVACMHAGAEDFIEKGGDIRELKLRIDRALELARVRQRVEVLEAELAIVEPRRLVGDSDGMREVKGLIAAASKDARVTVLISGETGTGKELVARAIHASGPRSQYAFVPVSIPSLPSSTLESELFGYEPGAFTDAKQRHIGLIERAHGGVLFLDEIGDLPVTTQVKLLRFLEERVFTRLGGQAEIGTDVQLVAATNADLLGAISRGDFREDLYYRLKVCEIRLPPLRARVEDLPALVEFLEKKLGARGRGIKGLSAEAMDALRSYDWPGNVRELRNALESALLKSGLRRHSTVELTDLPEEIRTLSGWDEPSSSPGGSAEEMVPLPLDEAIAIAELEQVERSLKATNGKKTEAWKLLGLNDRFVFSNRVRRLCQRFPELVRRYPAVSAAFLSGNKHN